MFKAINNFYGKHPVLSNVALLVATAIMLSLLVLVFMDLWTSHGSVRHVPYVKGNIMDEAIAKIEDADLEYVIYDSIYDNNRAKGEVIDVFPRANTTVKPGRTVFLTINAFSPKQVKVTQPIQGVSSRAARAYLESVGATHVVIENVPSEYADLVERATANGKPLTQGSTFPVNALITLYVGHVPTETAEDYYEEGATYTPSDSIAVDEDLSGADDLDFIDETGTLPPSDDEYAE